MFRQDLPSKMPETCRDSDKIFQKISKRFSKILSQTYFADATCVKSYTDALRFGSDFKQIWYGLDLKNDVFIFDKDFASILY